MYVYQFFMYIYIGLEREDYYWADSPCTRSFWTAENIRKGKYQNTINEMKIRV